MSTAPKHERISIQDYLAGETFSDQRREYVAGIVYAPEGGSNRHNAVATNVIVALANQLRGRPCRAFNSDTKVRIRCGSFMTMCNWTNRTPRTSDG